MAHAVEQYWPGDLTGLAVTRYGHGMDCARIEVIEAGHPLPDAAGRAAAARFLEQANTLTENDLLLCLMSGGASALLVEPADGLSLDEKQAISRALLHSGAPIDEMNCVRKHLSAIKGGRLAAAAYPARVVTLAISDVPGDDPAVIGSGPTVGDPTTCADAVAISVRRGIQR
jgi:hydroxypyruvate reductase